MRTEWLAVSYLSTTIQQAHPGQQSYGNRGQKFYCSWVRCEGSDGRTEAQTVVHYKSEESTET